MRAPVVVGVDGSPGSTAALRWALAEARLREAPLRLVHAYQPATISVTGAGGGVAPVPFPLEDLERLRGIAEAAGRRVLADAVRELGTEAMGDVQVEKELVEGPAASALLEAGRGAGLLVLGSRGHGGFVGLLLGSVSQQCAQHPPCPVVILPPAADES